MSDDGKELFKKIEDELDIETSIKKIEEKKKYEEDDFSYVREKLRNISEIGEKSIEDLSELAGQTGEARHFEVLASLIKNTADTLKSLTGEHLEKAKLKKIKKETEEPIPVQNPQIGTVNNNLFVGNLQDILKQIETTKNEMREVIDVPRSD